MATQPSALSALVTQTQENSDSSQGEQEREQTTETASSSIYSYVSSFFCCFRRSRPALTSSGIGSRSSSSRNTAEDQNEGADKKAPTQYRPLVPFSPPPTFPLLLPPSSVPRPCLVLDLDETLIHSSFKPIAQPDFVLTIELEGVSHRVYVRKRPGCDVFLSSVSRHYETIVFTASLAKYADPLIDKIDTNNIIAARLFRESCVYHFGNYVKDLRHLGRPLSSTLIVDNSPFSYMFQPDNAIAISSWFHDKMDRQLFDLIPILEAAKDSDNIPLAIQNQRLQFSNGQVTIGAK